MLLVGAVLLAIFVLDSPWSLVVIGVAAVVDFGETAFWFWLSKRRRAQVGAETLIGALAQVTSPCYPDGQVRVAGELWQARCLPGAGAGETVRVTARDGLTLLVDPERNAAA